MLEVSQLTREFAAPQGGQVRALDQVSLRVAAGECVAVQGPSGCGKTTLLLAVGGLLRPGAGRVQVEGVDLWGLSPEERARFRARRIGFVFQQFHLIPYLSAVDNVLAPALAGGWEGAEKRAVELLERMHLGSRLHHVPAQLSTGERQRVALARAMLREPGLLLADEPTGNLDDTHAGAVIETLAHYARSGRAVLLVTHDRRALAHVSRVERMEQGRVVQPASAQDAAGR